MISLVIPTLNEERTLPVCLDAARKTSVPHEILVVDARSRDRTRELARELGARLLVSEKPQRAGQLNLGARASAGEVLLFLHADTLLPSRALERIMNCLKNPNVGGGAFARRFDSDSAFLKVTCALAELRNRVVGWHLGDQAMFVRREIFERLGGFPLQDRFEDLEFSWRLAAVSRVVTLRPPVLSSARRFELEGPVRRTARDFLATMRYLTLHGRASRNAPGRKTGANLTPNDGIAS